MNNSRLFSIRPYSKNATKMVKTPVRIKPLTVATPSSYKLVSYTNEADYLRKAMILDPCNAELKDVNDIIRSTANSEETEGVKSSWTKRLLGFGKCACLKKVNEEAAELTLATCAQKDDSVILEAADLIYHVILALLPLNISFESVMNIIKEQVNSSTQVNSLGAIEKLATRHYNRMVAIRNERLRKNFKVESVIASIIENLYNNVFRLSFLGARINISTYVNKSKIQDAVYNILYSVLLMLHYRNLSYQNVVDELYNRIKIRKKEAKASVKK